MRKETKDGIKIAFFWILVYPGGLGIFLLLVLILRPKGFLGFVWHLGGSILGFIAPWALITAVIIGWGLLWWWLRGPLGR